MIDEEQKVEMTAKKDSVLTNTRYDMTGKFLCIIDTVNIRSEASEQADVAGCLYRGATGKVLEAGDTWTKIQSGSVTGYVANDLILTDAEATEKAEEYQGYMATAKQGNVCVRLEAAEDGEILYLTLSGEKFIACDKESSNGWYNVRLADGTEINSIPTAIRHNMAYTSKDRDNESVVMNQSIGDNICLPSLSSLTSLPGILSGRKMKEFANKYAAEMSVKMVDTNQFVYFQF